MRSGAKVCKSCRSRQGLSNDYLLAKIRFDTAENEPPKVCQKNRQKLGKSYKHHRLKRGETNGVKNLRIVRGDELREMEPHLDPAATAALYSPDAGTLIPYELRLKGSVRERPNHSKF